MRYFPSVWLIVPCQVYPRCTGSRKVHFGCNPGGYAGSRCQSCHVQMPILGLKFQDEFLGCIFSTCLPLTFHIGINSVFFQANEMLLSGRKLTAQEACGKGLVSQVFWPGTFTQEVMVRIKELASCNPVVRQIHSLTCVTFCF